jgi:hypothetical protein
MPSPRGFPGGSYSGQVKIYFFKDSKKKIIWIRIYQVYRIKDSDILFLFRALYF